MKFRALLMTFALAGAGVTLSSAAHADKGPPKNLKVLEFNGKKFKKGMKTFTKGLGVKCKACHVKGAFDSDDIAAKKAGRKFFEATVGNKDAGARDAALTTLLAALKLDKAKKPAKVWAGVDMLEKKKKKKK